jgi:hypothetical protein
LFSGILLSRIHGKYIIRSDADQSGVSVIDQQHFHQRSVCPCSMDENMASEDSPEILESANLLEKIVSNPYDYDSHVAYITLQRKLGNSEDLRQARQVFHSFFPLSEGTFATCNFLDINGLSDRLELWLQWLDDEEPAADSDDSVNAIFDLYELAVSDYLCKTAVKASQC